MAIAKGRPSEFKYWLENISYLKDEEKQNVIALVNEWTRDGIIGIMTFEEAIQFIDREIMYYQQEFIDSFYGDGNISENIITKLDHFSSTLKAFTYHADSYLTFFTKYKESPGEWANVYYQLLPFIKKLKPFLNNEGNNLPKIFMDLLLSKEVGEKVKTHLLVNGKVSEKRFMQVVGTIDKYFCIFAEKQKEVACKNIGIDKNVLRRLNNEIIEEYIHSLKRKENKNCAQQ